MFKTWSPEATAVKVKLYNTGSDNESGSGTAGTYAMRKNNTTGVWSCTIPGDLKNQYYTYLVTVNGITRETQDIYAKAAGVNCVQLQPVFDFASVDESTPSSTTNRNWGYDPVNYNVPEGSYSSNPYDGNVRITEFKQMIRALHDRGISVIMDVVYNHTSSTDSCFERTVPGYYYRMNGSGHLQVYSWTDSPSYADGDVNRDGVVRIADVTCVQKYLVELLVLDQAQLLLADVNQDGEVSIADATLIQMMIAN